MPLFACPFCPGPFLWSGWRSCSLVLLQFSPTWCFLGVGKGRETVLAGGTPTRLPSLLSSLGHLQAADQSYSASWGSTRL